MQFSRRNFLVGTLAGSGVVGPMGMAMSEPGSIAKGATSFSGTTILYVFLRGGMDGLNFVVPTYGPNRTNYELHRPNIQVPTAGNFATLPLGDGWGFHPAATGLHNVYNQGKLAVVHAAGLPLNSISRSHFDAEEMIELGTPGTLSTSSGWLARHLNSAPGVHGNLLIPSLASGSSQPTSLLGSYNTMTVDEAGSFHPKERGRSSHRESYLENIAAMYGAGSDDLSLAAESSVEAVEILDDLDLGSDYSPAGGANYGNSSIGRQLSLIAQVMSLDLGLRAATVDYGGWDTHNGQGNFLGNGDGGGYADRLGDLSTALGAFWTDLNSRGLGNKIITVVNSEFGRRVRENGNMGTDHGSGNPMIVFGGKVLGGKYGNFLGLNSDNGELLDNQDVQATTDIRRVLGTVVQEGLENPNLSNVFPGYSGYQPMPFLPTSQDSMFASSFE